MQGNCDNDATEGKARDFKLLIDVKQIGVGKPVSEFARICSTKKKYWSKQAMTQRMDNLLREQK